MNDDTLKELVLKHDNSIENLASSVKDLVESNKDITAQLKDIMNYLAKQQIFDNKLDNIMESFKRVYTRLEKVEETQSNSIGCNAVQLLTKDINNLTKDVNNLTTEINSHDGYINKLDNRFSNYPTSTSVKWFLAILIGYSISFGVYVVGSIDSLNSTNAKISIMLERDIKDTAALYHKLEIKK